MSYRTDRCVLFDPTRLEWVYYNVILLYVGFVVARGIHELGHSIANWLAGGIFSLNELTISWFFIVPMGIMPYDTSSLLVIYAGAIPTILIGWYVGFNYNLKSLDGPCGGRNKWKRYRGLVTGFLLQALWDSAYLLPLDITPFDEHAGGDGVAAAEFFRNMGLHTTEIAGQTIVVNPQYAIAGAFIVGTFYVIWRTYRCAPMFTQGCSI